MMIINLKTTKTLGVNVPLPLLGSGGELIEWLCPLDPKLSSRKTQSMSLLGQSGHGFLQRKCLLLTQSGHRPTSMPSLYCTNRFQDQFGHAQASSAHLDADLYYYLCND